MEVCGGWRWRWCGRAKNVSDDDGAVRTARSPGNHAWLVRGRGLTGSEGMPSNVPMAAPQVTATHEQSHIINMALLLETVWGDLVIDLDIEQSPDACRNILKLAKARYFTQNLIYAVRVGAGGNGRWCATGCPRGNGTGGASIYGYLDTAVQVGSKQPSLSAKDAAPEESSRKRFLKSSLCGRRLETSTSTSCPKGRVVAIEMKGIADTIGSQFAIVLQDGTDLSELDIIGSTESTNNENSSSSNSPVSLGWVVEDTNHVLEKIAAAYVDPEGRPYADIRILRALVVHDPFEDPPGLDKLLTQRGIMLAKETKPLDDDTKEETETEDDHRHHADHWRVIDSPSPERPEQEIVPLRIPVSEIEDDEEQAEQDLQKLRERERQLQKQQDRGRAVVLEMLGDLPDADIQAPENVLFICKLNPATQDEDLELIFSRFDEKVKVEIIRDHDTQASLQYAFAEFTTQKQAAEAYFKMNNALVDDRRIKVDFSQSVAKLWDKYHQRLKKTTTAPMPRLGGLEGGGGGGGGRGGGGNFGGERRNNNGKGAAGYRDRRGERERIDSRQHGVDRQRYGSRRGEEQQQNDRPFFNNGSSWRPKGDGERRESKFGQKRHNQIEEGGQRHHMSANDQRYSEGPDEFGRYPMRPEQHPSRERRDCDNRNSHPTAVRRPRERSPREDDDRDARGRRPVEERHRPRSGGEEEKDSFDDGDSRDSRGRRRRREHKRNNEDRRPKSVDKDDPRRGDKQRDDEYSSGERRERRKRSRSYSDRHEEEDDESRRRRRKHNRGEESAKDERRHRKKHSTSRKDDKRSKRSSRQDDDDHRHRRRHDSDDEAEDYSRRKHRRDDHRPKKKEHDDDDTRDRRDRDRERDRSRHRRERDDRHDDAAIHDDSKRHSSSNKRNRSRS